MTDNVNHPSHYTNHPSGIECIQITQHMGYCIGNAIKYLWRLDAKYGGNKDIEDLEKAIFYIKREIALRKKKQDKPKQEGNSWSDAQDLYNKGKNKG